MASSPLPILYSARDQGAARAVVSCFEAGKPRPNPAAFAVLDDGAGISYGAHQATHRSGSLWKVISSYIQNPRAQFAEALRPYSQLLQSAATVDIQSAASNAALKAALIQASADREMLAAQNEIFDRDYMKPALAECARRGWRTPLALATVYDSLIQGGWRRCSKPIVINDERVWLKSYYAVRRDYLKGLKSKAAQNSVYRPLSLLALALGDNWHLVAPFQLQVGRSLVGVTEDDIAANTTQPATLREII
jgi:hypothetical protein